MKLRTVQILRGMSVAGGVAVYLVLEQNLLRARPRWGVIKRPRAEGSVVVASIE